MIRFFDVTVDFSGNNPLFFDASFSCEKGSYTIITGSSGSGKTTLLMLMLGAVPATEGRVVVMGKMLDELSARKLAKLRRKIGVIYQDFRLLPHRSVFDNVLLVPQALGFKHRDALHKTTKVIRRLGLESVAHRLPDELSGGEKQRVAIARATVHEPMILLADEPTGNLDQDATVEVLKLFDELHHKGGTILLATHDEVVTQSVLKPTLRLENRQIHTVEHS